MMPDVVELRRDFLVTAPDALSAPIMAWESGCLSAFGPAVAVIGAFDGVHLGHRSLIDSAVTDGRMHGWRTVAVTFDPDPDAVVSTRPALKLTTHDDRLALLARSGVDAVLVIPFTPELSKLDHASFFSQVLLAACDVRAIHVGSDFRLGYHGASTVPVMQGWCSEHGIALTGHELVSCEGEVVSATHIRSHIAEGDLARAESELGRRYLVRGRIRSGRGEGTGMGFPTANVEVPHGVQLPKEGVYSGLSLVEGSVWPAAINVGVPPTFCDRPESASLEAHLIGFSGDVYGHEISLVFARLLRGLVKFSSVDELVRTVLDNIDSVKDEFGESGVVLDDL